MSSNKIDQLIREILSNDPDEVCEVALSLDTEGFMATLVEAGNPLNTCYGASVEEALTALFEYNKVSN